MTAAEATKRDHDRFMSDVQRFLKGCACVSKAIARGLRQRRIGKTIGDRRTPVFSVWPANLKASWPRQYWTWTMVSSDGDMMQTDAGLRYPAQLELVYVRLFDRVVQIARITMPSHISGPYRVR